MTAALEGGEWSAARPGRTLPPGKTRYPFYRRLGGPQGRSGRAENLVPTGIRSRTAQPVVSRYTDWATRPTIMNKYIYIYTYIYIYIYVYIHTRTYRHLFNISEFLGYWHSWSHTILMSVLSFKFPQQNAVYVIVLPDWWLKCLILQIWIHFNGSRRHVWTRETKAKHCNSNWICDINNRRPVQRNPAAFFSFEVSPFG